MAVCFRGADLLRTETFCSLRCAVLCKCSFNVPWIIFGTTSFAFAPFFSFTEFPILCNLKILRNTVALYQFHRIAHSLLSFTRIFVLQLVSWPAHVCCSVVFFTQATSARCRSTTHQSVAFCFVMSPLN